MKALIVTGRGVQDQELLYPYYRLQEAGFEVDVYAKGGKEFKTIGGLSFQPTPNGHADIHAYELLIIPGGVKAMEHMRLDTWLVDFISAYHASGGVIGAICSGAQLLISAGLVKGRTISAYPSIRIDVENAGGTWSGEVTNCDRIITAPHYRDLGPWMKEVLNAVGTVSAFKREAMLDQYYR